MQVDIHIPLTVFEEPSVQAPRADPITTTGALHLAAGILLQAVRDAAHGDAEAKYWLENDGLFFADTLGFDPYAVRRWINSGRKLRKKSGKI